MERKIQIVNHGIKHEDDISVRKIKTSIFDDGILDDEFREFAKRNNELNFHWYRSDIPNFHSLKIVDGKVVYEVGVGNSIEALGYLSLVRNRTNSLKTLSEGRFANLRKIIEKNGTFYLTNLYFGMSQTIIGITADDEIVLLRRSRKLSEGPGRYNAFAGFISGANEIDRKKIGITNFVGQAKAELIEESGLNSELIDDNRLQLLGMVRGLYNAYLPDLTWSYKFSDLTKRELLESMKGAKKYDKVHLEHDSVFFLPLDKIPLLFSGKNIIDSRGVKFDPMISEDDHSKTGIVDDTTGALLSYVMNYNLDYFEEVKRILEKKGLKIEVITTDSNKRYYLK